MYTVAVNFYVGFSLVELNFHLVKFISLVNGQTMADKQVKISVLNSERTGGL